MTTPYSSDYIEHARRSYSLYVMQFRAIPAITDGMKAGGRRALWTARDGAKYKSATLAGATMPIHPHQSPEGAINTLAAQYGNNIPLFTGDSAFGTLIAPTEYSASRYTSVKASEFTKDVLYKDIEIVPMTENYDGSLEEPVHFLPLIPIVLLNPSEGIAVGYATNILPRALDDIILAQITLLQGGTNISPLNPTFYPLGSVCQRVEETPRGTAYYFDGEVEIKDTSTAVIKRLPYGMHHSTAEDKLYKNGGEHLLDIIDSTKDTIHFELRFKRGFLKDKTPEQLIDMLGLSVRQFENLNVVDFNGTRVKSTTDVELIREFTEWRLKWYVARYERLRDLLKRDLQRFYDIRIAIEKKVNAIARKTASRAELREILEELGIVHTDYIADLPVYRFTEEEYKKNEQRIIDGEKTLSEYEDMLGSESKRKKVYISELKEILTKFNKGVYDTFSK